MYFGYQAMWTYTFVPIAFVLVMTVGIALAFVFSVGGARGKPSAARYAKAWAVVLLVGTIADLAYAVATGQWSSFLAAYGWAPIVEMSLLAAMFIGAMWIMTASYLREGNRRGEDPGTVRRGTHG